MCCLRVENHTSFPTAKSNRFSFFFNKTFTYSVTPPISLETISNFFLSLFYFVFVVVFYFFPRSWQEEKLVSLFLLRSPKFTIFLILFKNMPLSTLLILSVCRVSVSESLWLSGRAARCRIRRSEVRFLKVNRNVSLSYVRNKTKNFLHRSRAILENLWFNQAIYS